MSDPGDKNRKKNKKIDVIKNPQDQDPTFVFDPLKELLMQYANQYRSNSTRNSSDSDEKLVRKARHNSSRFSKSDLKNKSKHGLSKQSHSPVYE
ncbi:MAG TPA: hypothetical protein VD694_00510 [Nitrososphaeraceae archaeon]|nr:hypothetical protein [Nitrososphaeraceae archaeon]